VAAAKEEQEEQEEARAALSLLCTFIHVFVQIA
jgi:hypothetical protein